MTAPTKWAVSEPDTTNLDAITAATTGEDLLFRALADAIEAMGKFAVAGKSLADATRMLDQIREEFEMKAGCQLRPAKRSEDG